MDVCINMYRHRGWRRGYWCLIIVGWFFPWGILIFSEIENHSFHVFRHCQCFVGRIEFREFLRIFWFFYKLSTISKVELFLIVSGVSRAKCGISKNVLNKIHLKVGGDYVCINKPFQVDELNLEFLKFSSQITLNRIYLIFDKNVIQYISS